MTSGIYWVLNLVTADFYIGSSIDVEYRWSDHRYTLERETHANIVLQRAWIKYGSSAFKFELLEECDREDLLRVEQWYLDHLQPTYNIVRFAASIMKGRRHTEKTREKMRQSKLGKRHSPEHIARIVEAKTGMRYRPRKLKTYESMTIPGWTGERLPAITREQRNQSQVCLDS